jgi:uncharacterized protein (DUF2249 family)
MSIKGLTTPVEFYMLDLSKIPPSLRHLTLLAQRFGKSDDTERAKVIREASPEMLEQLKALVFESEDVLDDWLAGPESIGPRFSDEYVAFSAMRMASDSI